MSVSAYWRREQRARISRRRLLGMTAMSAFGLAVAASCREKGGSPLSLPLRTQGRRIVDREGHRFKLVGVNWYGAEEQDHVVGGLDFAHVRAIAKSVRQLGFNSVRLPWSNEMYELNPVIPDARLTANPQLKGKRALEVFDAVIDALANEGLVVILDNHMSDADWCCSESDGNGLWYTERYPEAKWIEDWQGIVERYRNRPSIVGADLRNEPRQGANWGGDPALDWPAAAERCGNAILRVNPNLLVFVEGIVYAVDLSGVRTRPVELGLPNRLVYSPHDYSWFHERTSNYTDIETALDARWGFLLEEGRPYTAPVWLGEFGTCHVDATCLDAASGQGFWFKSLHRYLAERDVDWAYWALNGTQSSGRTRKLGAEETYGILDAPWRAPASKQLVSVLASHVSPVTNTP